MLTRIDAMRTGELPGAESTVVEEHLRRCPSCGESVDDLMQLSTAVRSLAATDAAVPAPQDRFEVIDHSGLTVLVAFSPRGLTMLRTGCSEDEFRVAYEQKMGRVLGSGTLPDELRRQVIAALDGEGVRDPAVDLRDRREFDLAVLDVLRKIPRGEVRTYGWVAREAGRPAAVRAVGNICARNVVPLVVPCHRVVPADGGIGHYAFGAAMKRELLRREGVPVEELETLAREGVRFIGSKTTHIFCVPTCRYARRIQETNRVPFHDEKEAAAHGFRPCKRCSPVVAA
ncbi:MAG: methylated-DNA--[protein]-cysteine S-methyltransferase [Thermoanaerobaculia bacterium]